MTSSPTFEGKLAAKLATLKISRAEIAPHLRPLSAEEAHIAALCYRGVAPHDPDDDLIDAAVTRADEARGRGLSSHKIAFYAATHGAGLSLARLGRLDREHG